MPELNVNNIVTPPDFEFKGGPWTYLLCKLLGWLITLVSLGLLYPWSITMTEHWRVSNTYVNGRKLKLGLYYFFIAPDLQQWKAQNTHFDD